MYARRRKDHSPASSDQQVPEDARSQMKDDRDDQTTGERWSSLPMVLLLSVLLLSTLYLLRYDNSQLAVAEQAIRSLRTHVVELSKLTHGGVAEQRQSHDCGAEVEAMRRKMEEQRQRADAAEANLRKSSAEIEACKQELTTQAKEKRVLAKRLGIKLAGENMAGA